MQRLLLYSLFASVISANPVQQHEAGVTVAHLAVTEEGVKFEETLLLDTTHNALTIQVPHHRDVVASTVIMDFDKNVTMRYVPSMDACYLTASVQLYTSQHTEAKPLPIAAYQDKDFGPVHAEVEALHQWVMKARVLPEQPTSHNVLHPPMTSLCHNIPIYILMEVGGADPGRTRREAESCETPAKRCALIWKACHYYEVKNCRQATLDKRFGVKADRDYDLINCEDKTAHVIDQVMCCEACCEEEATDSLPHCTRLDPICSVETEMTFEEAVAATQERLRGGEPTPEEPEDEPEDEPDSTPAEPEPEPVVPAELVLVKKVEVKLVDDLSLVDNQLGDEWVYDPDYDGVVVLPDPQ